MAEPITCPHCHRPRATAADVARWEAEFDDHAEASDCPSWASAICWHKGITRCYRKPLDRHRRLEARRV